MRDVGITTWSNPPTVSEWDDILLSISRFLYLSARQAYMVWQNLSKLCHKWRSLTIIRTNDTAISVVTASASSRLFMPLWSFRPHWALQIETDIKQCLHWRERLPPLMSERRIKRQLAFLKDSHWTWRQSQIRWITYAWAEKDCVAQTLPKAIVTTHCRSAW